MSSLDDDSLMVFLINYEKLYSFGKVQSFCIKYLQFCSIKITSEWYLASVNRIEIYQNHVGRGLLKKIKFLYPQNAKPIFHSFFHFLFLATITKFYSQRKPKCKVNVFWRFPKTHLSRVAAKRRCSNTLQGLSRIFTLENIKFKVVCIVHRRRENCF